jgi:hypothetical protein
MKFSTADDHFDRAERGMNRFVTGAATDSPEIHRKSWPQNRVRIASTMRSAACPSPYGFTERDIFS